MFNTCGEMELKLAGEREVLRTDAMPLYSPKIPHDLT
jgi:hypothetical protein